MFPKKPASLSAYVRGFPVRLQLVARNGKDKLLFRIAAAVERLFAT
jgi:Asp-tRNA(Asn)/Glu-tRNA(Gln) amidotransferase A subunit family amidase